MTALPGRLDDPREIFVRIKTAYCALKKGGICIILEIAEFIFFD